MPRRRPLVFRFSAALLLAGLLFAGASFAADKPDAHSNAVPPDSAPVDEPLIREMKRMADVYALAQAYEADPISPDQAIYQGAIPALLRRLDPHSVFFDPGQFEQLQQMERSTSKGFGTIVSVLPGRVIVLQVTPGTPSGRSGIAPGDEILAVNNIRLDRLEPEQLIQLLTEAKQKPAQLYVRRQGTPNLLEFKLVPEEMQTKSVDRAYMLEPGIGYVRVVSFEPRTGALLHEEIEKLGGAKLKGLVIDLRGNPGGVVTAALETCALFLEQGQKILSVRGRKTEPQDQKVPYANQPYKFKVAVLVNEKTASASEIVAGALQDHDRAAIIGVPTFGKGLVQSVFPLAEKTGMALTTALYYTPSGRSIQKPFHEGDFALAATAAHPNQQTEFRTDNGRLVRGGGGITPDQIVEPAGKNRLEIVLEGSGVFLAFATEYSRDHKVDANFEVTSSLLDQFEAFAAARNIQPSIGEWAGVLDFVSMHLKAEIFNQTLGVEKGDEVEARADPQVRAALEAVR
jgi:carboxyl-terminal processing protease